MTAATDLLAIGPHPDDVELFAGGVVARAVADGHRVVLLDLTRGERASRGDVETRAAEATEAASALGVAARENLGLPDGGVRDDDHSTQQLADVIRRLRPRVVLAPWSEARHPDHAAASKLIDRAVFLARLANTPGTEPPHHVGRVLYYPQRVVPAVNVIVDTSAVWSSKHAAILAHASQVTPDPNAPRTLVGSPAAIRAIEARDRYFGAQIGVEFGEPLIHRGAIPVDDIVSHFGDRPEAHFVSTEGGA